MTIDIQKYVVECDTCQRKKSKMVAPPSLLQPLHIPPQKWFEVSMDFIMGLSTSEGNDSIFVVINRLTKYYHFIVFHPKQKQSKLHIVM